MTFVTKLAGFEYTEYVKYTDKGDLPVIKAENAGRDGFKQTIYSKVLAESVEHLKRSKLIGNELILVFVGAGVGNVATLPKGQKFFLGPNIAMARPYSGIQTKFLEYFYQSPRGKKLLLAASKAVAQPSLSMGNIRQTPIAVPSKEEQFQIVQIIENQFTLISKLEKTVDDALNETIALKHSILKKSFEGRLVDYISNDSVEILLTIIREEKRIYLESQKKIIRSNPKQKRDMETKKSILEILKESSGSISAQELWEKSTSEGDIERFYSEIKQIYHLIDELKLETESLLSLKDESK
ncbi:restriction endonuclease subunit S [Pedobacter psychrotolerans]|uniref:restriction endonuclease subunit S n=1 Tax=Pedobacter psychrotolerans TaxID=1843235 RepID=UPI0021D13066|nr:restriction endonuclease subunit S [Pedobacter psychrotolerans]